MILCDKQCIIELHMGRIRTIIIITLLIEGVVIDYLLFFIIAWWLIFIFPNDKIGRLSYCNQLGKLIVLM